jgi:hypothetical protein
MIIGAATEVQRNSGHPRLAATMAIRCPVACVVPKMDDGYAMLGDGPGNIGNHLLNEREEADIPLGDNVELHRSSAQ